MQLVQWFIEQRVLVKHAKQLVEPRMRTTGDADAAGPLYGQGAAPAGSSTDSACWAAPCWRALHARLQRCTQCCTECEAPHEAVPASSIFTPCACVAAVQALQPDKTWLNIFYREMPRSRKWKPSSSGCLLSPRSRRAE